MMGNNRKSPFEKWRKRGYGHRTDDISFLGSDPNDFLEFVIDVFFFHV